MRIKTSCGHEFEAPERYKKYVNTGTTFDCPECNSLQIMEGEVLLFQTRDFHLVLHEKSGGHWPKDGVNTGYVEL